jgi:polygalacturonase
LSRRTSNIAVTGSGTLDGGASRENWWAWRNRTSVVTLVEMGEKDVPLAKRVFGEGFNLRPCLWQPYRCKNTNVTVRNVAVSGTGPNTDGCDPDSCRDMLVESCKFSTGDDCIAVKSGRNRDGRQLGMPSENLIVRDCDMKDGHGALTVGSECSGGVRRVFFDRCRLDSPHLNQALRVIEDIYYRDITIGQIADSVLQIDFYYQEGEKGRKNRWCATSTFATSRRRRASGRCTCAASRRRRCAACTSRIAPSTTWNCRTWWKTPKMFRCAR